MELQKDRENLKDIRAFAADESGVGVIEPVSYTHLDVYKRQVGYRVEHMVIDPAAIVSVDDFSHEPEILFYGFRFPAHFFHKMEIKYVCAVQTLSLIHI